MFSDINPDTVIGRERTHSMQEVLTFEAENVDTNSPLHLLYLEL